jgi:hypothetical protein
MSSHPRLYGCETWPFTLREEHRLSTPDTRTMRIFRLKLNEVIGGKGKVSVLNQLLTTSMKAYGRVDIWIHMFSTSALAGGEWSVTRLGHFTPVERAHGTHWIGGWVDHRAGLDDLILDPTEARTPTRRSSIL